MQDTIAAYPGEQDDFHVETVASLPDAQHLLAGVVPFDLIILAYNMPRMNGLAGLTAVIKAFSHMKVLLIEGIAPVEVALQAMGLRAQGFLAKSVTAKPMVKTIHFVLAGEQYFSFGFSEAPPEPKQAFMRLSPREMETLGHLCPGPQTRKSPVCLTWPK